jgi:hypothetical protein
MRKQIQFRKHSGNVSMKVLLLLLLLSLPFIGSDCNDTVANSPADLSGTWKLGYIGGNLQDVCMGEVVTYQSNGTATLQCPGSSAITRNFTVSNSVLTYTQTNVQYRITDLTATTLTLNGVNVGRILGYYRTPADNQKENSTSGVIGINSSE